MAEDDAEQELPKGEGMVLLQPDNHNKKYEALFVEIDTGQIKLPMFQREFVWEKEQSAKLIDSILKGFPIGTFIFWKTREELRSYKEVGNHTLPETQKGDYVQYILDGQQRITSLYAIRKGIRITKDGKEIDYRDIFVNLHHDPDADEQIVVTEKDESKRYVPVHDILSLPLGTFYKSLPPDLADRVEKYKNKLTGYDFSTITIKDYPIEVACEVFSRINTGGKSLTVFEIMVAKTYDESKKFDLALEYELLRDGSDDEKECLVAAKFETLPESIAMQCVSAIGCGSRPGYSKNQAREVHRELGAHEGGALCRGRFHSLRTSGAGVAIAPVSSARRAVDLFFPYDQE